MPGGFREERALHARFAEHRQHGEWFALVSEMEELIASNPPPAKPAKAPRPERIGGPIRFAELPREREARIQREEDARAKAVGDKHLRELEEAGEIRFPFRAMEGVQ
jgi:hypothetical protein